MFNTYKIVGDKVSVIDHKAFQFYLENSKTRDKKKINENRHYAKIISSIYSKVADAVIESEGGVYIDNMFYIIPQPYPKKGFIRITNGKTLKGTMNLHTEGKIYSILFINLFRDKKHQVWDMHSGFFRKLTKNFSDFLKAKSPKYIFSLDSILKTNNKSIK